MSKETPTTTTTSKISSARNVSKAPMPSPPSVPDENHFETPPLNLLLHCPLPPPRSPLNAIVDPSQTQTQTPFGSIYKDTFDSSKRRFSFSDRLATTPSKNASRASLAGPISASGIRAPQRVSRAISVASSESETTPHFELQQDESFWADHNVQVLIRIRPLSRMERVSQGLGRCLRQESAQTLVWLGHPETRFTFDHVACDTISQESLFQVAGLPMVENCLSGYNSCMFAYGQTGSGKTYTMMGEIYEIEGKLNEDCGLTPRIFEHLFKRIMVEEESRRDETLKYSCKCSFLEIYNEQITDLLEPSSTNLQLREDLKKGVYVENLTEYNVRNVNEVVKLLLQGAANRKVAATHKNSESSRSHSVFTCIIESRWGKDSMTHFRFARLNLVDLAGSERQKSSGAEGDRLKEAANINKSLSTLGLVIMSLVDLAHGKHRHVPYRDSRLTFLLQDSLGGNSKTTIIANISPSICSANETLSTLKFAQRAKLIQNNAKVNEDTSGDINALQREIQQLKGQLSFLMKQNNVSRASPSCVPSFEKSRFTELSEEYGPLGDKMKIDNHGIQDVQNKIKCMEANLVGALRREKTTETALQKLEAELEHVKCLARQREDDAQHTKMMLRFRDEEIKRLELLTEGMLSADKYLVKENKALLEEIQLLRARMDENPELTQYAVENYRLREQLQMFQNFYEHGERETLLAEVLELRNQLLDMLEGKNQSSTSDKNQEYDSTKELEDCRMMNSKLIREVEELRMELKNNPNSSQTTLDSVKSMSVQIDTGDGTSSYIQRNGEVLQSYKDKNAALVVPFEVIEKELTDARLWIEEMEREQGCLVIEEPKVQDMLQGQSVLHLGNRFSEFGDLDRQNIDLAAEGSKEIDRMVFQAKLDKMTKDLQDVRLLNSQFQKEQVLQLSCQQEAELIREQVEMETARTILQLQEEVATLQCKLDEKFCYMTEENVELRKNIATKEEEIKAINMEWERATLELTGFLIEGSRSLKNVSSQIESITCSFSQANAWISERVERAAKIYIEKEETILQLKRSLEDAQNMVVDMGQKLSSLKGVTLALTELQHLDNDEISKDHISMLLHDKIDTVKMLEKKLKFKEVEIIEKEKCASVAFVVMNWLFDSQKAAQKNETKHTIPISSPVKMAYLKVSEAEGDANALALEDAMTQVELAGLGVFESENAINALHEDTKMHMIALQTNVLEVSYAYKELVQNLVKEVREMRERCMDIRAEYKNSDHCAVDTKSSQVYRHQKFDDLFQMLCQARDKLAKLNCTLKVIEDFIHAEGNVFERSSTDGGLHAEAWNRESSSSSSDFSTDSDSFGNKLDASLSICWSNSPENISEQMVDLKFEGSTLRSTHKHSEKPNMPLKDFCENELAKFFLEKELGMLFNDLNALHVQLAALANELNLGHCPDLENLKPLIQSSELALLKANGGFHNNEKIADDEKIDHARSFLTKFEEANATIKEADFMLNALVKANDNAKQLTGMWKHTGEELMMERAKLIEEVEHLKSLNSVKEAESQLLHDQAHCSLVEIGSLMSSLEESYMKLKCNEEKLKAVYSYAFSMGMEMLQFLSNSRSFLEDICSKIVEKDIVLFVLYQCYLGELTKKNPFLQAETVFPLLRQINKLHNISSNGENMIMSTSGKSIDEGVQNEVSHNVEGVDMSLSNDDLTYENLALKKELSRKEVLLEGLLFDFSLLQESTSNKKDIKDESDKLVRSLGYVWHELELKTRQLDEILVQHKELECRLTDTEEALFTSNSNLAHANEMIESFSEQNSELKMLLKDLYLKKSEVEEQLEEKEEVVKSLEEEILRLSSSIEKKFLSLVKDIEDNLSRVTSERDQLKEEVQSLNDKLEMACALVDEKEAIIVEAHQESEVSKIYAEQKEEEVKILESSIEELESTINVLEKKVYEMDDEVERHRLIRDTLELELKALRQRLLTVENLKENMDSESTDVEQNQNQISRQLHNKELELHQAHTQIKLLEEERAVQDKEIKQYKDYVTELMLHAEAQASQYQQKYKTLEAMVSEVKIDLENATNSTSEVPTSYKTDKSSVRARGSSSPFRCIASLVQQMNLEKDQELSTARLRIEELEALAASRQKEVCMLNARLAAADSMAHDVIRDLLGVKLDMNNFANLADQYHVKKLVEDAHQQTEDLLEKEQEILNLRKQINDLKEERESCVLEIKKRDGDLLAAQISIEQLRERDHVLFAQNEMLKTDKTNLNKKVAELDDLVKKLLRTESTQAQTHITPIRKIQQLKLGNNDFTKRLEQSEKLISRVNGELARYFKFSRDNTIGHGLGTSHRKNKAQVG